MSDQKCIYRYDITGDGRSGEGTAVCGKSASEHDGLHDFQPPLEITDEAVEAALTYWNDYTDSAVDIRIDMKRTLEAALRVMQKGQDK